MRPSLLPALGLLCLAALPVAAAPCGNDATGFNQWKSAFATEARSAGIRERGLAALNAARYAARTIAADRNQKSFDYSLQTFMEKRGSATIIKQGRQRRARDAGFYDAMEKRFGVPASVVIAIHGMETGFGHFMGDSNVISAITTLAYDCRRSEFFTLHALAALRLVDHGIVSSDSIGARHGELGHTQFLPGNVERYGIDGNGDGRLDMNNPADALMSTANFLAGKGWRPGQGYQEGQPNFTVIKQWNAAGVYQKAIAIMAARIEG